jgi:zinc/manganese transport system ATP-binding protein
VTTLPVVSAENLSLRIGDRLLWSNVSFQLGRGESLAVLGPNGVGKTSLLRVLLGLRRPTEGRVRLDGEDPRRRRSCVGYVSQQRSFERDVALRGRDLVGLGLDGNRFGCGLRSTADRERIERALADTGSGVYGNVAVGRLSGGEQQRLRVAQALVSQPRVVLADEPLLSLDLASQRIVVDLLDRYRNESGAPLIVVSHDVNPLLHSVTRVLYLADRSWALGTVEEVMTSETLSRLYETDVDVLEVRGRIVVVGAADQRGDR